MVIIFSDSGLYWGRKGGQVCPAKRKKKSRNKCSIDVVSTKQNQYVLI